MYDWLDDADARPVLTVTANRRLARVLSAEVAAREAGRGRLAWRRPAIHAWQDWLGMLLTTASPQDGLPTRINAHQSRVIWERCIRREISDPLLNVAMLVRQSRTAWERLHQFGVSLEECARTAGGRDQHQFARAAQRYRAELEHEDWIDEVAVTALVGDLIRAGRIDVPERIRVAGFDRMVPQNAALLDAARAAGAAVEIVPPGPQEGRTVLHGFESAEAEWRAAGAWARRELERNPAQRLAVVATNLEQDAARVARLLREGFVPGWQWAEERYAAAVNVSYGRALSAYPACTVALLLARWLCADLDSRDVSLLLGSPLVGIAGPGGRARLELRLRRLPEQSWSPTVLARIWRRRDETADASDWQARLERLAELRKGLPQRSAPSFWAARIDDALSLFNWPGQAPLDSAAFQLVNRWRELLNELARLELVSPVITAAEAVGRLSAMASETVFQPESGSPVLQLLGPLEAAGMQFDGLWIAGLTASNWPPSGRPLALIARSLQRRHGMPDADPQDTLDYARRVLSRLRCSGGSIVCSYPRSDADAPQTATSLLSQLTETHGSPPADPGWHAGRLVPASGAPGVDHDPVPPVRDGESVAGGAATIQRQLTEPFSAFAQGRLGVRCLDPMRPGLAPWLRGDLLHGALHALYGGLPAQAELAGWDEADLERRVEAALTTAFRRHERHADAMLRALLRLERERAARLLRQVVAQDADRAPFRVTAVEQAREAVIGGVHLQLRLDRMDRLDDGGIVILDYKTGTRRRLLGGDGEPKDYQLVVYACAVEGTVAGLGLFNVDSRAVDIDAVGPAFSPADGFGNRLARWKERVVAAGRALGKGDVRVDGRPSAQDARPLALLSRIEELRRDD
jgi:ATP-dependent helicase/nuclease subunit B